MGASAWLRPCPKGKARDWNWHNVFGFWCLPILLTISLTGAVIGYRWASDLVYAAAGEKAPARAEGQRREPTKEKAGAA